MEVPTKEQLKKKKVVELRAELSKLHLPQSGELTLRERVCLR